MSKPLRLVVALLTASALVVATFALWPRAPEAERAALRALDCASRQDADCLFDLTTPEERAAYGLDRERFRRVLQAYVYPAFGSRLRPVGEIGYDRNPVQQSCAVSREFEGSQGQSVPIGVFAAKTDDGARAPGLVTNLLLTAGQARYAGSLLTSGPERKLEIWARQAKEDAQALTDLGIKGIYRTPSEGLVPWASWLAHCEARLEQIRSAKSAPKQS